MLIAAHITDLVRRAQIGDERALNSALAAVRPRLYLYALKLCKFNTYAEDVLQDAYIQAYMNFSSLRSPEAFYPWVRSIIQRTAWRQTKNNSRNVALTDATLSDAAITNEIESRFEEQMYASHLYERITTLTPTLQSALVLRYFSSMNEYTDIAALLDVPVGTIRSRLNEGKKQLQKSWNGGAGIDLSEKIRTEGEEWNEFYRSHWSNLYDDRSARDSFMKHLIPDVNISFTSGAKVRGRQILERELSDDLRFGSRFVPKSFFNIGDIGVIEGPNTNAAEHPDRCPPMTTLIVQRCTSQVVSMNIHHAPVPIDNCCNDGITNCVTRNAMSN